ncbi:hypothetical protein IKN40_03465, partial [bacterium]|nr:hypothetical protein [bacterium]
VIQKSFVTSALIIQPWNFNLFILTPFHHISVEISVFVIFIFEVNPILTGVVQKLGSVKV